MFRSIARRTGLAVAAICLLTTAACSSSGHATSSTGSSAVAPAGGTAVQVKGFEFRPGSLTVAKGATVTWTFDDSANHNVSVTKGPVTFHSADLSGGKTFSHTFTTAGTYSYICTIHPYMKASIVVK